SSIVTVQQNTGNIKAMAQNTEYEVGDEQGNGQTSLNFNVDKDWGGGQGFQLGSTLKPFVAMAWIGSGKSMRDQVDASRNNYDGARFPAYCLPGGHARIGSDGWRPKNAIADMHKPMRMDYGLYWSINTATIAAAYNTDLCAINDITNPAGITDAENIEGLDPSNPSFVLGAYNVSPLTMASASSTLGSGGTYCEPRAIESIVDADGNEYTVPPIQCSPGSLNPENIKELNNTLTA